MNDPAFERINVICDEVSAGHVEIFDMAGIRNEDEKKRCLSFLRGYCMASGAALTAISQTNMMMTPSERNPFPEEDRISDEHVKVHVIYAADESEAAVKAAGLIGKGYAVVYNCENTSPEKTRDEVDFLSGFCYGICGQIRVLADKLFLLVPEGVETDF